MKLKSIYFYWKWVGWMETHVQILLNFRFFPEWYVKEYFILFKDDGKISNLSDWMNMGECGQFRGSIGKLNIPFPFSSPFDLLTRSRLEGLTEFGRQRPTGWFNDLSRHHTTRHDSKILVSHYFARRCYPVNPILFHSHR